MRRGGKFSAAALFIAHKKIHIFRTGLINIFQKAVRADFVFCGFAA